MSIIKISKAGAEYLRRRFANGQPARIRDVPHAYFLEPTRKMRRYRFRSVMLRTAPKEEVPKLNRRARRHLAAQIRREAWGEYSRDYASWGSE